MICLSGAGQVVLTPTGGALPGETGHVASPRPTPYLKQRKSLKYMGLQDQLAVLAAGLAVDSAGLGPRIAGPRTGLYLAVGYIPFELADIEPVLESSIEQAPAGPTFSIRKFSEAGYQRAHPLLAFRCLPNMPAYHIAANFGITGPYVVAYPGVGQLYLALQQAVMDLKAGRIEQALVGGVAHQRNFLVEHHMGRLEPALARGRLRDAASIMILERADQLTSRSSPGAIPKALRLTELRVDYTPFDPLTESPACAESVQLDGEAPRDILPCGNYESLWFGPASLGVALARHFAADGGPEQEGGEPHGAAPRERALTHRASSGDGIYCESRWEWRA